MGNASGPSRISPCSDPRDVQESDDEDEPDEGKGKADEKKSEEPSAPPKVNTKLAALKDPASDSPSQTPPHFAKCLMSLESPPELGVVRSHPNMLTFPTLTDGIDEKREDRVLSDCRHNSLTKKSGGKLGPPVRAVSWSNNDIQKKTIRLSKHALKDRRLVKIVSDATNLVYDMETIRASITNSTENVLGSSDTVGNIMTEKDSTMTTPASASSAASIYSNPGSSRVFRNSVLSPSVNDVPAGSDENVKTFIQRFFPLVDSKLPPACLQTLFTLDYDVFLLASLPSPFCKLPLTCTSVLVLHRLGSVKRLKMKWPTIVKYLLKIEEQYKDVPYHSKWHAADVVAMMAYFLCCGWFKEALTPEQQLVATLAAASHDVGHDGTNNHYHVAMKTQIGLAYPDSVLEYHHVATATGIRGMDGCDWTAPISHYEGAWTLFSALILRTDPALHPPGKRKPFTDLANSTEKEREQAGTKLLPLIELLHLADISNACKPTKVARKWSESYYKEYLKIGKLSRENDLELPMFKKGQKLQSLPGTQIGFINFVCLPSFKDLIVFLPEAKACVENLQTNLAYWMEEKIKLERPGGGRKSTEKDETLPILGNNLTKDGPGGLGSRETTSKSVLSTGSSLEIILVETQSQVEAAERKEKEKQVAKRLSSNDCSPPPCFDNQGQPDLPVSVEDTLRASKLLKDVEILKSPAENPPVLI